ncbi:HAD family hydrolase [Pleionea litopenaei]|uniref:HAD family hydrolase n=1 Tax=Pleionea litopenaei TaxID=3070815 RepID=A0AA51RXC4_9GAMM|nr:HAD family hydrolase [Pleionea sp. HL-JVS1]WMS89255.1 HAD family hydrolase [Pleionea sp. HL-JVS1]
MDSQKLIILDLDETLIYATEENLKYDDGFKVGNYYVHPRPHLESFLRFCFAHFNVGVWTSSGETYAQLVVEAIFKPEQSLDFVWSRRRCVRRFDAIRYEEYFIKDLNKLKKYGYQLKDMIMIDDTPRKLERHYGNLVRVSAFEGNTLDDELKLLSDYLATISNVDDIRPLEKRGWRHRVERNSIKNEPN